MEGGSLSTEDSKIEPPNRERTKKGKSRTLHSGKKKVPRFGPQEKRNIIDPKKTRRAASRAARKKGALMGGTGEDSCHRLNGEKFPRRVLLGEREVTKLRQVEWKEKEAERALLKGGSIRNEKKLTNGFDLEERRDRNNEEKQCESELLEQAWQFAGGTFT